MSTEIRRSSQSIKKCLNLIQDSAVSFSPRLSKTPAKRKKEECLLFLSFGADYGARTRHLNLGKVALYQMS